METSSRESRSIGAPVQGRLCSGTAGATAGRILPRLSPPAWGFGGFVRCREAREEKTSSSLPCLHG